MNEELERPYGTQPDIPSGTIETTKTPAVEICNHCHKGKVDGKCPTSGGRPPETMDELEKKWNERLVDCIRTDWVDTEDWAGVVKANYADGASDIEIRVMLAISNDLWGRLLKEEKKFSETIEAGRQMSEAWWVRTGRTELKNKDFSYQGFRINMANRFDWREKTDSDVTSKGEKVDGLAVTFVKPESN